MGGKHNSSISNFNFSYSRLTAHYSLLAIMLPEISQEDLYKLLMGGPRRVHLVGVAGSGMSGLARLLIQRGHQVTGSDIGEGSDAEVLRRLGVQCFRGHAPEHVIHPDFVCYSSAISNDNPELLEAQRRGIPLVRRARTLAVLAQERHQIVISGTHGKTTTSSMIAHILSMVGKAPSFFIGAHVSSLGANAGMGDGPDFVIEADESDGTMSEFKPHDLVILNIEPEHLDFYENLETIEQTFEALARSATGRVIYCADDDGASRVGSKFEHRVSYTLHTSQSSSEESCWRATNIRAEETSTCFEVWQGNKNLGTATLVVPGRHNVSNALAALIVSLGLGVSFEEAVAALGRFSGAQRRFERLFESDQFLLVDDYAHHPSEVCATIEAARQKRRKRLVAVFQPHRYSRTRVFHRDFGHALNAADRVFITDVYAASEMPMEKVDGKLIVDELYLILGRNEKTVTYEPNLWRLKERVGCELQEGDLALIMGAGNIHQISRVLAAELRIYDDLFKLVSSKTVLRRYEPMAKHTTLRVGGFAKLWIEPSNEEDLVRVLKYCNDHSTARESSGKACPLKVTFVGRGSNLLVRDAGISGVTIHLGSEVFTKIEVDSERVIAGAGARLKQIVMTAKRSNLAGLEFLEGIPGSVGGALVMNAGAMGNSIFDVVEQVKIMDMKGHVMEKTPFELQVKYRVCEGLRDHIALAVVLKAQHGNPDEIASRLKQFEEKRWSSQPGASSAGCIFKNPPGTTAGKLIDELGLKGLNFGSARVSTIHGNFIVNDGGATASEILSLISIIKERARRERGVELEMEIVVIGDEGW